MRTLSFLIVGLLILAAMLLLARLFSAHYPAATSGTVGLFLALWLAVSAFNMWVGVSQAAYSFGEELPIFLLIFGLPAAIAIFLRFKLP